MTDQGQRVFYEAELERFLEEADARGLFTEADERRLRAAFHAAAADPRRSLTSLLPRLLLVDEASPDRASARWSLYETVREQTRDSRLFHAA